MSEPPDRDKLRDKIQFIRNLSMTRRYAHLSMEHKVRAVERL